MPWTDRVVLVTGAGSGLGAAMAQAFGAVGATVVVADRDAVTAQQTAVAMGPHATALEIDIADEATVANAFATVDRLFGRLDVLVNNAGVTGHAIGDGPMADCPTEAWDALMSINLRGTFLSCKYGLSRMIPSKRGVILNTASVLGMVGCQDAFKSHAYQVSKAGIIGITRAIAAYYAKQGIRANALAPGLVDTPATAGVKTRPELMAFLEQMQPLKPLGLPRDVAPAAVFLCSDEASWITGQIPSCAIHYASELKYDSSIVRPLGIFRLHYCARQDAKDQRVH